MLLQGFQRMLLSVRMVVWRRSMSERRAGNALVPAIVVGLVLFALAGSILGCGGSVVEFKPNTVYGLALREEQGQQGMSEEAFAAALDDVDAWVESLFGTPDLPQWGEVLRVSGDSAAGLVDVTQLQRAAGAVSSDEEGQHYGLYREHCVSCHGVTGDGRGPAAMLQSPYPRDFRAGFFKFKSTVRGQKPLRSDLVRTLRRGIPGSSMPSFALVESSDLDAIIDYLVYLSIRGEVERRLLQLTFTEFDYGSGRAEDRWLRPPMKAIASDQGESAGETEAISEEDSELASQCAVIEEVVRNVVGSWLKAEEFIVDVPEVPATVLEVKPLTETELADATALFQGQIANCASCHGVEGDGKTKLPADYDDWTKEWTTRLGIAPSDKERLAPFIAAGAFKPKSMSPRHLGMGSYRGGGAPEDIYRRIAAGIDGTSMPAVNLLEAPGPTGLTSDQVWLLVRYLNHLGSRTAWDVEQATLQDVTVIGDPVATVLEGSESTVSGDRLEGGSLAKPGAEEERE